MSTYTINTSPDNTGIAPSGYRWSAWFGDMDEGTATGFGETEADAVEDLIANHDVPWGAG